MLASFFMWAGEGGGVLFHTPCWLHFYLRSFSYTSRATFIFMRGVSLTHPVLSRFLCREFLLHIPCFFFFFFFFSPRPLFILIFLFYLGSFSYTSRAGFIFIWGVSLTRPMLASFLCGEFLLHIPCWLHFYLRSFSYTSRAGFIFVFGVSLTHPVLASFLCLEFLLHILCWLNIYADSFSYTSRATFIFMRGISLTHPVLAFLSLSFLFFIWGVSLPHPVLALFLSGEFLLHIPC